MRELSAAASPADAIPTGFREAMRRLASTVCIITSADDGMWYGMTATAVTSVSMSPCALLVCINEGAAFHSVVAHSRRFCVNLLRSHQSELAGVFAGRRKGTSRFDVGTWAASEQGLPYLVDAQASVFCDVDVALHYKTHTIFVGEVTGVCCHPQVGPLIYQDGQYVAGVPVGAVGLQPSMRT
ncbi:MAG: flavin reductase [Burkholderiales bacterium]|nr:flavin reductase [Burkholderiales bacterium]